MLRFSKKLFQAFSKQKQSHKSVIQLFKDRKLYYQSNSPELEKDDFFYKNKGKAVYCGYDPTSSSLHLGNLVSILMLARMNLYGLKPIFLVGGATGLIGDPSGKNKERQLLDAQIVQNNIECLKIQISNIYSNIQKNLSQNSSFYNVEPENALNLKEFKPEIINNYDFYEKINFIEFLRNIGKNFRMGPLLSKQMVAKRLESEEGISFAEFSYSLMQGYDYSQLYEKKQCILQIGGSDQWGNILNGTQLIKKQLNKQSYAITMPLLLTKSGAKFGKSEGNALFLNSEKTPLKQIYQYFYNTADQDLERYLSIFTFFDKQQITDIIKNHDLAKQLRKGQQILADQVIKILGSYKHVDRQFFTLTHQELKSKSLQFIQQLFEGKAKNEPSSCLKITRQQLSEFQQIADLFVKAGVTKSKKQVRRQIQAGGVYINNDRITKQSAERTGQFVEHLNKTILYQKFLILRWGKKKYFFVEVQ